LAAEALEAGAAIDSVLDRRRIDLGGAAAWGQYLDDYRYSEGQWGLFGTTAAVATLSLRARPPGASRHLREALPLIPEARTGYDPRIAEKVEKPKSDFKNMIRLAFIAEALRPGERQISAAERPEIVKDILTFSQGDPYWHSTSALGQGPPPRGDVFTTAYVLYALRRYEHPIGELRHYRTWLANELDTRADVRARPDLVALIGLALIPEETDPQEPQQIATTRKRCVQELDHWRQQEPGILLERPLFHGFNLGEWTDYTFLHPEIVASLFLLRASNPRPTRRYVADVTSELVQNVKRREYFEGQPGMAATVDQMWASKLLDAFYKTNADPTRRHVLRPVLIATARMRWIVVAVAVAAFAVVAAATGSPETGGITAAIAVLIAAAINFLVNWASQSS
jgi:hypothetical protein